MIANIFGNLFFRIWFKRLWRGMPSVSQVRRRFLLADKLSSLGRKNVIPLHRNIGGVDVEWLGEDEEVAKGVIIYLHGGGFAVRAKLTDRRFCHEISRRSGLSVVLVPYRLAPEYPYPHGLNDCCRVYEALIDAGIPPGNLILLGHSAGANYALTLLMRARDQGLPQPAVAIVLSAPTDMTAQSPSVIANAKRDVMQGPDIWRWVRKTYLATTPVDHPDVSPLFGDWAGLAPLYFHVSDSEVLLDDSRRAVDRARESGTAAHLSIWHDVPHNFYFLDFLPESRRFHKQLIGCLNIVMAPEVMVLESQSERPQDR